MDLLLNSLNTAGLCSVCFGIGRRLVPLPVEMKEMLDLPLHKHTVSVCWRCKYVIGRYKRLLDSAHSYYHKLTSLLQSEFEPVQLVIQDSWSQSAVIHFDTAVSHISPISTSEHNILTITRHTDSRMYGIETTTKHTAIQTCMNDVFVSIEHDSDDECLAKFKTAPLKKRKMAKKDMTIEVLERQKRKLDFNILDYDINNDPINDDAVNNDAFNDDAVNNDAINDDVNNDAVNDGGVPLRSRTRKGRCECERCGRAFACASALRVHTDSVHLKLRPYRCDRCDKRYATPGALWTHRRCGHGATPLPKDHVCERCGRAFKTRGSLTAHARTHAASRPYRCEACAATFKHNSALYMHRRLVHRQPPAGATVTRLLSKGLPLRCVRCPASFKHSSGLYLHARLRHGAHTTKTDATADDPDDTGRQSRPVLDAGLSQNG